MLKAFLRFSGNMLDLRHYKRCYLKQLSNQRGIKMFRVLVIGSTGSGKSTTINAIFGKEKVKVGYGVAPETARMKTWHINSRLAFIDTPGLGDESLKDEKYIKSIRNRIRNGRINAVLVLLEGQTRDIGTPYQLFNALKYELKKLPLLVAINKADIAISGRCWNSDINEPDQILSEFLDTKSDSVQRRINDNTGLRIKKPICYSADKNWNLTALLDKLFQSF